MPFKNILTPFNKLYPNGPTTEPVVQIEPVIGTRLQWERGGEWVTLVTAPMPDGMPEQDFLSSPEAKHAYLDRARINELIVALREARDGSYGKDQ